MQKTAPKTTYYSKNESILKRAKLGPNAWAIAHAKWSVWVKNLKRQKGAQNHCATTLKMLCAKNRAKKYLILDKREHFQNGQNWPRCMGYSSCKMVSLGQKFKTAERCANHCATTLKMLCAKNCSKKHLILEKWEHFKNGQIWPRYMGYSPCKMVSFCQKFQTLKRHEKRLCD